ncbi:uncharacterized protein LOC128158180 [Crassostrea angulata]|uniref:uncharacterized protein LOC128158180 n=1 Tax=Magallana angulata TaxID=2784310 RepID=UPI0022B0D050|nr:uncharacterized protein LOC128158180 [Crassostrea angulata]
MCGDCFHWKMQQYFGIRRKLSLKSLILSVLWINVYSWSWFEAKDLCQSNGTIIKTRSNSDNYWTKYYRRRSHWISKLGCSSNDMLSSYKTYDVPSDLITAGLCQELCMEHFGSNRIFLFAYGEKKCICLRDKLMDLHLHFDNCKSDCIGDFELTPDCGDKVLVLLSKPITKQSDALSNSTCIAMSCDTEQTKDDLIGHKDCKTVCSESENRPQKNQNPKYCTETRIMAYLESVLNKSCDAANFESSRKTWFILKRQVYQSYDREDVNLTEFEKKNFFIDCQRCGIDSCPNIDCNNKKGDIVCRNGLTKADLHSMPTPSTQTTVWSQQARKERNTVNHTWVTDDVSTTVMTKQTFLMTSNAIDYRENISTLKTTSINQINRQRNEDETEINVGIVAVSFLVCALILAGAFCFVRIRKKFLLKRERPSTSILTEFSSEKIKQTQSHENDKNQGINKMSVGNSPKECLYDFADNSKLEEETHYNQENEVLYHHLRESVPTNNVNDNTYMVAGYKTSDEDNVYFGRVEDPYDHLRGADRTRQEDNTYDHAPIVGESDYSSFNIDVGRNTSQSHVEESIYDHFEG